MKCILCNHPDTQIFYREDKKKYYKCPKCSLIFLDNKNYLSSKDERIRYEQHQNFVDDEKYIQFLAKLFVPLKDRLSNHKEGLDFGCGPGPALAKMFNDAGYIMDVYDPYFFPNETIFSKPYDFISCTEVLEHIFDPATVILDLNKILKKREAIASLFFLIKIKQLFRRRGKFLYLAELTYFLRFFAERLYKQC